MGLRAGGAGLMRAERTRDDVCERAAVKTDSQIRSGHRKGRPTLALARVIKASKK